MNEPILKFIAQISFIHRTLLISIHLGCTCWAFFWNCPVVLYNSHEGQREKMLFLKHCYVPGTVLVIFKKKVYAEKVASQPQEYAKTLPWNFQSEDLPELSVASSRSLTLAKVQVPSCHLYPLCLRIVWEGNSPKHAIPKWICRGGWSLCRETWATSSGVVH